MAIITIFSYANTQILVIAANISPSLTRGCHYERGKYRNGITREKLRVAVDLLNFKVDYLNYMTAVNICKKYNISMPTMYRIIEREGINKRGYLCNKKD